MKIRIDAPRENIPSLLRRCGYVFQHDEGEEKSFVRTLGASGYPRFHIYARLRGFAIELSIHLDQKQHTYGETTRHHGEYENEGPLKEEIARLLALTEGELS
jgi:hypothetical protein